jgi:hypothetical protein
MEASPSFVIAADSFVRSRDLKKCNRKKQKRMSSSNETKKPPPTIGEILNKSVASALRGGVAGAAAMGANVAALMWLRTTVRVQRTQLSLPVGK